MIAATLEQPIEGVQESLRLFRVTYEWKIASPHGLLFLNRIISHYHTWKSFARMRYLGDIEDSECAFAVRILGISRANALAETIFVGDVVLPDIQRRLAGEKNIIVSVVWKRDT